MKTLRDRYISQQRELRIQAIYRDPDLQINQPAIDALVNKVDPEAETWCTGGAVRPGGARCAIRWRSPLPRHLRLARCGAPRPDAGAATSPLRRSDLEVT